MNKIKILITCKTYWDVPKLLYLSTSISILNVSRPIRTHNDDQRGHRSRGGGRVRPSGPSFSREQSNIAKSFLINSLRIARRVQTEICMCRTRIHTRNDSPLYEISKENRRLVHFWLKKGEKRTMRIKWRRIEEVSRIYSLFVTRQDAIYENVVLE